MRKPSCDEKGGGASNLTVNIGGKIRPYEW